MELEKASTDNESKKKKAITDVKAIEEKLSKQETLVWQQKQFNKFKIRAKKRNEKKNKSHNIFWLFFAVYSICDVIYR